MAYYILTDHEFRYKETGGSFTAWISCDLTNAQDNGNGTFSVINLPNINIAIGDFQVRIKAAGARPAGLVLSSSTAFTYTAPVYDADAVSYLQAAGVDSLDTTIYYPSTAQQITGKAIYEAFDVFVKAGKSAGWWAKMAAIYPLILNTAASQKWNLKDPRDLDAAYRLTFAGTITRSAFGMQGDGASGYANSYFNPRPLVGLTSPFAYGANISLSANGFKVDMGANAGGGVEYFIGENNATVLNSLGLSTSTVLDDYKGFIQSITTATGLAFVKDGAQFASAPTPFSGSHPDAIMYLLALNFNNAPGFYSARRLDFAYFANTGLTVAEASTFDTHVRNLNIALKRGVKMVDVFFGDSITMGSIGITNGSFRWTTLYATNKGTTELNKGISGTTAQNSTPVVANNMRDIATAQIPIFSHAHNRLFLSFGANDVGVNTANFTVANYKNDLIEIINIARGKGWPDSKIIVQGPTYFNQTGRNGYVGTSGVTVAADSTRHIAHNTAAGEACTATGVVFANVYNYMVANGGDSLLAADGLHPNNAGHAVIKDYMVSL